MHLANTLLKSIYSFTFLINSAKAKNNESAGKNVQPNHSSLKYQRKNLRKVWDNEQHNDAGIEKLLRLFLVAIQFIFPGIYIRHAFGKNGIVFKDIAVETYVIFKTILPFVFLVTGFYTSVYAILITAYLLAETILYVTTLIFVTDIFSKPKSYRRSVLLLFFNYLEIAFDFAVIYGGLQLLNKEAKSIIDFIYFSFVTSATIGYGDIYPASDLGKIMVSLHSVIFLIFIVLFLNFFSSKVEDEEYFIDKKTDE